MRRGLDSGSCGHWPLPTRVVALLAQLPDKWAGRLRERDGDAGRLLQAPVAGTPRDTIERAGAAVFLALLA